LVDEAQDTNQDQWEVVKYLMEENLATGMSDGSLFIVGDIKQTIYGFQGAEAGIMNDVYLRYKNYLEEEYLTVSYRTTKPVLDVINGAFDVSEKQKHISAFKDDVGAVKIVVATVKPETAEDRVLELDDIATLIATDVGALLQQNLLHEKHRGRKIEPKDIVILARDRNEKTITALRQAFYNANIPIAFNEKINYKKYNAILDFIALLKLCVIEDDTKSAYGVLAGPIFGIEESELSTFFYKGVKIEDILSRYTALNDLISLLSKALFCEGLTAFFYEIYARYKVHYTKQDAEVLAKFIENTNKVKQFEFVQYIQNFEKAEQVLVNKPQGENSVTFTTAHSSKGLQYPVVFFLETAKPQIGRSDSKVLVHNGAIIWNNNKNDRSEIVDKIIQNKIEAMHEEEFRLQYVAMSRAEERFVYVGNNYNTRRTEDGELQNPNSMFHKLQKAMTSEFVHTKEGRFEIDELIRETF
jgi:ATP-dependent helicase/nuclease subunit A